MSSCGNGFTVADCSGISDGLLVYAVVATVTLLLLLADRVIAAALRASRRRRE